MNTLYLYNPENDIALGHNHLARFTPPRAAERLARYGAPLLWWLAGESDAVYVPAAEDGAYAAGLTRWSDEMRCRFGYGGGIVHSLSEANGLTAEPWGWSAHTLRMLAEGGMPVPEMSTERLDTIRLLSHRRTSVEINRRLREALACVWGDLLQADGAVEAACGAEVDARLQNMGSGVFVKSPWSSSGRGVADGRRMTRQRIRERCMSIISRQGSVLIEPSYAKVADFAMLYRSDGLGSVSSVGLSLFFNEREASYAGNLVASDCSIARRLCRMIPEALLRDVNRRMECILSELAGSCYRGYMGVDMMVVTLGQDGSRCAIVPCVELNLRMTMGVVAHELFGRLCKCGYMSADDVATMRVVPGKSPAATPGALPLVPYNDYFNIELSPVHRELL